MCCCVGVVRKHSDPQMVSMRSPQPREVEQGSVEQAECPGTCLSRVHLRRLTASCGTICCPGPSAAFLRGVRMGIEAFLVGGLHACTPKARSPSRRPPRWMRVALLSCPSVQRRMHCDSPGPGSRQNGRTSHKELGAAVLL